MRTGRWNAAGFAAGFVFPLDFFDSTPDPGSAAAALGWAAAAGVLVWAVGWFLAKAKP